MGHLTKHIVRATSAQAQGAPLRYLVMVSFRAMLLVSALALATQTRANIRALRFRPGGTVTTAASPNLPVNGDMTFRLLIKRNPWDLVSREILALLDSNGTHRISLGLNTSPWAVAYVSDNGWMPDAHRYGDLGAVYHGCPNGTVYEDWWLVYKAPTASADGFLRVYRNGALAHFYSDTDFFDLPIPAGTDMNWKGGDLMLRLGDPTPGTMADYQILDVCWWTAAFSAEEIAAVNVRQLCGVEPAAARLADLLWYIRPTNAFTDRIACELGASTGNPAMDGVLSGDVTYVTDTPRLDGWEVPDKIVPPDPGPTPLAAKATDSAVTVSSQPGSSDTASRSLVVSEGVLWPYSNIAQAEITEPGVAEASFTGLKPGTTYYVTGQWLDAEGNVATRQLSVATLGPSPETQGPTRSLHFTGAAEAVTCVDPWLERGGFYRMPYESDTTIRLMLRRSPAMKGPCRFLSQRAAAAGVFGYSRFAIGLTANDHLVAGASDGQQWFEAESGSSISTSGYEDVWLVYAAPTGSMDGSVKLYVDATLEATATIPAGTDMSWKKWDAQFVLGGLRDGVRNESIDYHMMEPAWWTKALTEDEMRAISGRPLYSLSDDVRQAGYLYWYARPHAAAGMVEPDIGASIGTAPRRDDETYAYVSCTIAPLFGTNTGGTVTYENDVPPALGGAPYAMSDVIAAMEAAAGLGDASPVYPRLNIDDSGDSTGIMDLSDTVRIARIVAGLEQTTSGRSL